VHKEIQGGITLRVADGVDGATATIRLGEELESDDGTNHTVRYSMRTGNHYESVWTMAKGPNNLEHHEYMEFRWGELIYRPSGALLCTQTVSSHPAFLICPQQGAVITKVEFADYGLASGSCNEDGTDDFMVNSSCTYTDSKKVVENACLGKHLCTISAGTFQADPCKGYSKYASVAVSCGGNNTSNTSSSFTSSAPSLISPLAAASEAAAMSEFASESPTPESQANTQGTPQGIPIQTPEIGAWVVRYPWDDQKASYFASSSADLGKVYELSQVCTTPLHLIRLSHTISMHSYNVLCQTKART
jgi:hypothetical protein